MVILEAGCAFDCYRPREQQVTSSRVKILQVLMATNRIDILDAALLRPGRIDRKIEFPNPNESSRFDILKIHSRKMNLKRGLDLRKVSLAPLSMQIVIREIE